MKTLKKIFEEQMGLTVQYNKDILKALKVFQNTLASAHSTQDAMDEFEVYIYNTYDDFSLIEEVLAVVQEAYEDAISTEEDLRAGTN